MSSSNSFSPLEDLGSLEIEDESAEAAEAGAKGKKIRLQDPIVWIDLEMTGLDVETDTIIEIACLVTDGRLNKKIVGPNIAINHPDIVLDNMNEWSQRQHGKSGLTERARKSKVGLKEAEDQVYDFVHAYTAAGHSQLAGSSVYCDLIFLRKYMPKLAGHLHYRLIDVSSVKEICRRWFPREYSNLPRKKCAHTAMSDIEESLNELKYYRQSVFKPHSRK